MIDRGYRCYVFDMFGEVVAEFHRGVTERKMRLSVRVMHTHLEIYSGVKKVLRT